MQFKHEELQQRIKGTEVLLGELKQELKNCSDNPTLWELSNLLEESYGYTVYLYEDSVAMYLGGALTPEEYESLFDEITEVFTDYDYTFDEANSTNIKFSYYKEGVNNLYMDLRKRFCERIPTGKMISEYREDCSVIKGN